LLLTSCRALEAFDMQRHRQFVLLAPAVAVQKPHAASEICKGGLVGGRLSSALPGQEIESRHLLAFRGGVQEIGAVVEIIEDGKRDGRALLSRQAGKQQLSDLEVKARTVLRLDQRVGRLLNAVVEKTQRGVAQRSVVDYVVEGAFADALSGFPVRSDDQSLAHGCENRLEGHMHRLIQCN